MKSGSGSTARCVACLVAACCFGLAASAQPAGIAPYYDFVHWTSVGRLDLALQKFAEDAVVVAGPLCTEAQPCVGRDQIGRRYLPLLRDRRLPLPIVDQRFDGEKLCTHGDSLAVPQTFARPLKLRAGQCIEMRDGHIAALQLKVQD